MTLSKKTRDGKSPTDVAPRPLATMSLALACASRSIVFEVKSRVGVKPLCAWCVDLMRHGRSDPEIAAPMIFRSEFLS